MQHTFSYGAIFSLILITALFQACSPEKESKPTPTIEGRWFTQSQYEMGGKVYSDNCARCHGEYGQGIVDDWRQPNPDGSFPPPPLNGTAHTWHHPFDILLKTINEGGIPLGGTMPAFADSLSREEKVATIAYFQSLWSDDVYNRWEKMNADQ